MIINFAPLGSSGGGSGSGSTVAWQQTVTAGTKIAQITIDGVPQNVFAPEGGSGSGSSVSYSQTLSAGTEIGQITIDGSATTIYAPAGGDSKIVVDFDRTSQADRASLYSTLYALYTAGSGDTINKTYTFYKSIDGRQSLPLDYYTFRSGVLVFGYVVAEKTGDNAQVNEQVYYVNSDGSDESIFYPVAGGGGSSVSYSQTLSAGTEIGQITIDGSATTIYAPAGGGSQGPTVIDFDAMSQAERATFYAELASVWSATSVNGDYVFLKSFPDYTPENAGTRQIRLQFLWIEGTTAYFGTATRKADNDNAILSWGLDLSSDGTISSRTNGVNGVSKGTDVVSYFNTWNQSITFNKSTSGFTTNSEPMTDGMAFGGSFYWFVVNAAQGDWGQAIPLLLFDVVDESGVTKTYEYPTISKQSVSETISGVSYTLSVTADYGDFYYKMLINENPYGANFQYIEKPKVQGISQAAYDALVQAGTVDANTLYVII